MSDQDKKKETSPMLGCTCSSDPFAGLPPELRPKAARKNSGLRKVTCPSCGVEYWTNRTTDFCAECVKKGLDKKLSEPPASNSSGGGES